ncbi:unnamed protein product, partial [Polarella glacialis]
VKSSSGCSGQGLPSHQHTVEGVLLEGDIGEGLPDGHVMHVGADGFLDMGEMDHVCGARQEDIDKLRTEVLKSVAALGSQSTCLICQEDFASGASVAWLPCGHVMHKARTVCTYEYMRQKDNMGKWEPYRLQPQWIQLYGGTYGSVVTGEVLIGFELLHSKFRAELPAMKMWPAYPDEYSPKEHFAKLRKATLHFSLYGLRDLVPTSAGAGDPIVCVKVKKWWQTERDEPKYYQVFFNYKELVEGSDGDNKDDNLHKWRSDALGQVGCRNYEFFQVRRLQIMLPDKAILQPFVTVRVYEKPTEVFGYKMFGDEGALVGESRQPLNKLYPCCWYDGVDLNLNYEYQERKIRAGVTRALLDCEARKSFVEETQEERDRVMEQTRETRRKEQIEVMKSLISMEEEKAEKIDSLALPMELRAYKRIHNEAGYQPQQRERLQLREEHRLNMELMQNFPTRYGEKLSNSAEGTGGPRVSSKLENSRKNVFVPDFWFQNAPLLRNSDIVRLDDDLMDWNFQFGKVHGFVKCAFKL